MAYSVAGICKRALQTMGTPKRITSIDEDSQLARDFTACYEILRDAEQRAYVWSFTVKRVVLSPVASDPAYGDAKQFQVPADFLRLAPYHIPTFQYDDLEREGDYFLSELRGDELNLRYARRVEDTTLFDPLFVEAFATRMAMELVQVNTESNTKKQILMVEYDRSIALAKSVNAIEKPPVESPEGTWAAVRRT